MEKSLNKSMEKRTVLQCPKCGGKMEFKGYRPLFPDCERCGLSLHVDECDEQQFKTQLD